MALHRIWENRQNALSIIKNILREKVLNIGKNEIDVIMSSG